MGVAKRTRKFATVKRLIGKRDERRKTQAEKNAELELTKKKEEPVREIPQMPSSMFFQHNTALVPPYQVLVDTNFLSRTVGAKLPLMETAMDCLYASVNIIITSCVMAELEKLGPKYRIALMIARDERWTRLTCDHKGTYADDCIVDRIQKHRIYIVGSMSSPSLWVFQAKRGTWQADQSTANDRDLKRRIRKVPGVPIMSVAKGKYVIERLPGAPTT
ncbi:Fcf1-domain-containing protein [Podospora aff. communis PSN243]|uniref:Fcf1-domain-containing protein n=1 Tax=Podospora aff. communis PSN243 TaxID=3040156 RepID=A0AAV9GZ85_9PEZI|nr:Fcf1-domain-containing protein [Podospora aff. communis PSN243]